jgi:hypothetical protein
MQTDHTYLSHPDQNCGVIYLTISPEALIDENQSEIEKASLAWSWTQSVKSESAYRENDDFVRRAVIDGPCSEWLL